jgi:succinoglycan biosynthesis protein ExoM
MGSADLMKYTCVVICTFNRPGLLRRAIETARNQALPPGHAAGVLVVDNSADANARDAVTAMIADAGLELAYLSVPEPNISVARNAGVAASRSDFVVFLDDDERCEPGWLSGLLTTADATGADLVFGAVLPEFPGGPPAWDPAGLTYERRLSWPTGTRITIHHDERVSGRWIGTGNSLLRRATCLADELPFDAALGIYGGEDYDLFVRLYDAGRHFAWCAEAVVHECVPADRTTMDYMRRRTYRTGQSWTKITVQRSAKPGRMVSRIAVRAAVQLALVTGQWGWARLRRAPDAMRRELKMAEVAGKLVWWTRPTGAR